MKGQFPRSALVLSLAFALAAAAAEPTRAPSKVLPAESARQGKVASAAVEVRMSKLIGMNVRNPGGQNLGEIKDVILDTNSGRIHYAVLSLGGFLGVGDKLFAVPLAKVRPDDKGKLVLDATKEQLKSMPAFESKHWPDWNTGAYRAELDSRYGAADVNARFRRASELLKSQVRDANGADIGDIKDVVVDLSNSRVHYVAVEFDRAWNPNDKLVAVPMSALGAVATAPPPQDRADAAAPPRNPPGVLSLETPSGPSKGPASATIGPSGVDTRPPAADPSPAAGVARLERQPRRTMTSYADDEDLVFKGTREQLQNAPEFDKDLYPDLRDAARRQEFDRRLPR